MIIKGKAPKQESRRDGNRRRVLGGALAPAAVSFRGDGSGAPAAFPVRAALAALGATLVALAVFAPQAGAANISSFAGSPTANDSRGGEIVRARDMDVYEATGQIYVADALGGTGNSNNPHLLSRFDGDGGFELAWGWDVVSGDGQTVFEHCAVAADCKKGLPGTARGQFDDPAGVAVDQSDGSIYVWDRNNRRVQKFDADGNFTSMFGKGVNQTSGGDVCPRPGFPGDVCRAGTAGSGAGQLGTAAVAFPGVFPKLAVDPVAPHNVYVTDPGNRRVLEYSSDGAFMRGWGFGVDTGAARFEICTAATTCQAGLAGAGPDNGRFGTNEPQHIDVDGDGIVYASDSNVGGRVLRFDARVSGDSDGAGSAAEDLLEPPLHAVANGGPLFNGATVGLKVDSGGGLFVARDPGAAETLVQEIDTTTDTEVPGSPHAVGDGLTGTVDSLAVNGLTDDIYVGYQGSSGSSFPACAVTLASICSGFFLLDDEGPAAPTAIGSPPADVGAHSATLEATIDPNRGGVFYRFEYSKDGIDWTPVSATDRIVGGDGPKTVSAAVTGLESNTLYRSRIAYKKIANTADSYSRTSSEATFLTDAVPPEVETRPARQVSDTSALLVARINPNNLPTTYRFEYGRTTAYGSAVPVPDGDAGSAGLERAFSQHVEGLRPGTTYHYRIVATNSKGVAEGLDAQFTTRTSVEPPPGRAYEMVTPPDKNNRISGYGRDFQGTVFPFPGIPSADGEGMLYTVNHGILDPNAGTAFPHERDVVLIRRQADGWRGQAVANVKSAAGAMGARIVLGGVSGDLKTSAWAYLSEIFPSGSGVGTRIFDDGGGYLGSGWYDWIRDPAFATSLPPQFQNDAALVDDNGERMVRWDGGPAPYRGLLGPDDPSHQQTAGKALYLQEPIGSGERSLLNVCTGTGSDATEVPERDANGTSLFSPSFPNVGALGNDLIGAQPCEEGSVTSHRGAVLGGGGTGPGGVGGPTATAMSTDGRRMFFLSPDPETKGSPFNGIVAQGDGQNGCIAISHTSPPAPAAENVGEDTECGPQLYVRHVNSAGEPVVRWISRPDVADQDIDLLGQTVFEGASHDGSTVYFRTNTPLVENDPNGTGAPVAGGVKTGSASSASWDLYRYDLPSDADADPDEGTLTRVSGGPSGTDDPNTNPSHGAAGAAARYISDDGDRAYFVTGSTIAGADNDSPAGGTTTPAGSPTNSTTRNLYMYERSGGNARWKFIAQLPFGVDSRTVAACASRNSHSGTSRDVSGTDGSSAWQGTNCVRGTSDGGLIAFESAAQLTTDDTDSAIDIYAYEAGEDRLTRVSAPPAGTEPYDCVFGPSGVSVRCNADFGYWNLAPGLQDRVGLDGYRHFNIAEDGSIYFESRLELVAADRNGAHYDTYRWRGGRLSLMSPGSSNDHAFYSGNGRDGTSVFFWTSQRIDPREIDEHDFDVYVARVGGGFPLPPEPPEGCKALTDACQGPGGAPSGIAPRSSAGGGANASPGVRPRLAVGRLGRKARRRAAKTGVIRLRVRSNVSGRVTVKARARIRARNGKVRRRLVARRAVRFRRSGSRVVRLRLRRAAVRQLRAGRRLRVSVRVTRPDARARTASFVLRRAAR